MISCTEFIPLYSELFKYIDRRDGHEAVVRYWEHIADTYVEPRLGALVDDKGMNGCWEYWEKALSEEASDCRREYDEEANVITSEMRFCPSRGLLNSLTHMEPYHDYCGHCAVLYSRVLEKRGIRFDHDNSQVEAARCFDKLYYIPKD